MALCPAKTATLVRAVPGSGSGRDGSPDVCSWKLVFSVRKRWGTRWWVGGVIHRVPHLAWGAKIKVPGLAMGRTFSRTNKIYDSLLCTS